MKRYFKQIWNERKSNFGLLVELLIVSIVMWYAVDFIYIEHKKNNEPLGYDISHCYILMVDLITNKNAAFDSTRAHTQNEDIIKLIERLKNEPEIETVAVGEYSFPMLFSNSSGHFSIKGVFDNKPITYKRVSPEFIKLFRLQGEKGENYEELMKVFNEYSCFVSDNIAQPETNLKGSSLINKHLLFLKDSLRIAQSILPMRNLRNSHRISGLFLLEHLPIKEYSAGKDFGIRVKPEQDHDIVNKIMSKANTHFKIGNVYIKSIIPYSKIDWSSNLDNQKQQQMYLFGIGFLILNIFLGLLGIFWFRTNKRQKDIALKMTLGATKTTIFKENIIEGLVLLLIATVPATIINLNIAYSELNQIFNMLYLSTGRFLITLFLAFLFMAITIIIAISIPAYKAMKTQPAIALHNE